MIAETVGLFACILVLGLIGIGPALWLTAPGEKRVAYALGIAPTFGFIVIGLISFPLVRYVAPVRTWALPVTALLIVTSIVIALRDWQRNKEALQAMRVSRRSLLMTIGSVGIGWLLLASPLLVNGIDYAVFRANPSDAFNYISLAETLRVAPWRTLLAGIDLTPQNVGGLARLAETSPTALFSARLLHLYLSLSKMSVLAWAAEIVRIPVYRFYYANHLLAFALALPMALTVGDRLRPAGYLKYLAAGAVALGFWARFVLETDAGFEISIIPVVLLLVFAWMQLEIEPARVVSRSRLLLAVAGAAVVCLAFPLVVVILAAFACYYLVALGRKLRPPRSLAYHSVTALLIVVILAVSGQLDYVVRSNAILISRADNERIYPPIVLWLIRADGASAVWGLPSSIILAPLPESARLPFREAASGLGLLWVCAALVAAFAVATQSTDVPQRTIFSMCIGGCLVAALWFVLDNDRVSGKAFTYIYPYLYMGMLAFPNYLARLFQPVVRRPVLLLLGGWLALQALVGPYLSFNHTAGEALGKAQTTVAVSETLKHGRQYDLSPIERYLATHPPQLLLVTIPRDEQWISTSEEAWPFAFYCMFVFSKYRAYFQSGLVIDNSMATPTLWLTELTRVPDYAVILKSVDYIGPGNLGTKVAETADLTLYQIKTENTKIFSEVEKVYREHEASKPPPRLVSRQTIGEARR